MPAGRDVIHHVSNTIGHRHFYMQVGIHNTPEDGVTQTVENGIFAERGVSLTIENVTYSLEYVIFHLGNVTSSLGDAMNHLGDVMNHLGDVMNHVST